MKYQSVRGTRTLRPGFVVDSRLELTTSVVLVVCECTHKISYYENSVTEGGRCTVDG